MNRATHSRIVVELTHVKCAYRSADCESENGTMNTLLRRTNHNIQLYHHVYGVGIVNLYGCYFVKRCIFYSFSLMSIVAGNELSLMSFCKEKQTNLYFV